MAITGVHTLFYTSQPEALRAVLRDAFGFPSVDAGDGWLIFRLPPAEIGVHPSSGSTEHALSFVCDDVAATLAELRAKPGIEVRAEPVDRGYGVVAELGLPGGVVVQVYEPRHPTAYDLPTGGTR